MPLNVQLVNAQVKDPQSGQMTPAGLIGSDAISTINTAKNQAVAAVQQKGVETLESIPDDYTALSNEVDEVKTQVIKCPLIDYGLTGMVYPVPGTEAGKTINPQGEIYAAYYAALSDLFPVDTGNVISAQYVTDNNDKHISTYVATYTGNSDSDFVERVEIAGANGENNYTVPATIKYIRVLFMRPLADGVNMSQNDIDTYFNAVISGLGEEFVRIKNKVNENENNISILTGKVTENNNVNLLETATLVEGKYAYNYNNAVVINNEALADYYKVDVSKITGKTVYVTTALAGSLRVILADENDNVINVESTAGTINVSWNISNDAKSLYISTLKTYTSKVKCLLKDKDIVILELLNKETDSDTEYRKIVSKNILDKVSSVSGKLDSEGNIVGDTLSCVTDYIAVESGKNIILSRDETTVTRTVERIRAAAFYDENKTLLNVVITPYTGAPSAWFEYVTTPNNCAFVRLNVLAATYVSTYYFMLEYGTSITEYEAYWIPYTVPPAKPFLADKKICAFGDSLASDGYKGHNTWIDRIGNYYGFGTVYNRGENGSFVTLKNANGETRSSYGYIDSNGYAYMRTAYTSQQSSVPSGFTEIAAGMCGDARVATIPLDTNIIIIEAGVNDWLSTTYVGDSGAELFEASYETMLSKIVTRLPSAKIFCCICPYYKTGDGATYEENFNKHRELIRTAAKKYGCTVIDLRSDMGVNVVNVDDYSSDGLHYYLEAGKTRMAETVIGAIDGYINTFAANT